MECLSFKCFTAVKFTDPRCFIKHPIKLLLLLMATLTIVAGCGSGNSNISKYNLPGEDIIEISATGANGRIPFKVLPDHAETTENRGISIPVVHNDQGLESMDYRLEIAKKPKYGSAIVQKDNSIIYVPGFRYVGSDSLVYRVRVNGKQATAKVNLLITCDDSCFSDETTTPQAGNDTTLKLSWKKTNEFVVGYIVHYKINTRQPSANVRPSELGQIDLKLGRDLRNQNRHTAKFLAGGDLGLLAGDEVCFQIRSYNENQFSPLSDQVCTVLN